MTLKGKDHQIELLTVSDRTNLEALLNGGGKTQVPCLRIQKEEIQDEETDQEGQPSVTWLYDSDDIIRYIAEHNLA